MVKRKEIGQKKKIKKRRSWMLLKQTISVLQVKANLSNAESHNQRQLRVHWRVESFPVGSRDVKGNCNKTQQQFKLLFPLPI